MAMGALGNGLFAAGHQEDALSVREADLATRRRVGASENSMLGMQSNIANSYQISGRLDEALRLRRDVFSGYLKLLGEHRNTLIAANNYAHCLFTLRRFEEAKSLMRKMIPVARRVLGHDNDLTLQMRLNYGRALYEDPGATLDDLRDAVTTLEDTARIARRVFGGAHPLTEGVGRELLKARAALRARETPPA